MAFIPGVMNVLMIEDNPSDVDIFKQMLDRVGFKNHITAFARGEEALAWMESQADALPQLIILDLELPGGMHGLEVLKKLKANRVWEPIPVLVNTTSTNHDDISKTYRHGATFFMQKLYDAGALGEVITHLKVTGRIKNA